MQHPAKIQVALLRGQTGLRHLVLHQREVRHELASAEIGPVEALSLGGATIEHRQVLGLGVIGLGGAGEHEVRLDDVGYISQQGGGALLPIILNECSQFLRRAAPHRLADVAGGDLVTQFIATQILEADGLQDMDAVDYPADGGLPVDRLEDPARCGGGHRVVGHPFDLHLGPGEAGILTPHVKPHPVRHHTALARTPPFWRAAPAGVTFTVPDVLSNRVDLGEPA